MRSIKNLKEKDITIPIVALGHIKNIHNCDNINRILDKINKELKDNIIYWTLSDSIKYWINHLKNHE